MEVMSVSRGLAGPEPSVNVGRSEPRNTCTTGGRGSSSGLCSAGGTDRGSACWRCAAQVLARPHSPNGHDCMGALFGFASSSPVAAA